MDTQFLPDPGIFVNHLDYARWYATQWALRIMDVTAHYDPDFIYTDGCTQGPFHGDQTGAGYKCNAMPLVMADFYNRALKKHGKADVFSVVKFRRPTNGTVTTAEFDFPDHVDTSQTWIREEAIGGWFFAPGFIYDPGSMIHFIIEAVCRDGCCALNIPVRPDGSLEELDEDTDAITNFKSSMEDLTKSLEAEEASRRTLEPAKGGLQIRYQRYTLH